MRVSAAAFIVVALCAAGDARGGDDRVDTPHTETGLAVAGGGDSDVGIGIVGLAALTRMKPGVAPYLWRLEAGMFTTFKAPTHDAPFRVPYQDYFVTLTLPHLADGLLRLDVRASFTRETTDTFYGLGNASMAPSPEGPSNPTDSYYLYGRMHPTLSLRARVRIAKDVFLLLGNSYTHDWLDISPASKIAHDRATASSDVRELLGGTNTHGVDLFEYGIMLDNRDDETAPARGTWDQLKLRLSPGGTETLPYRYGQLNAIVRGYGRVWKRVTFAGRIVGDLLFGDVPFYELARYEDSFAIGGTYGVRGVPAGRYYGRVKVFGNAEVRVHIADFVFTRIPFVLGGVAFFDAGRVFTELGDAHPELDGTALGLKLGTGLGVRLQQGRAFVVRGDVAWSPDARPLGVYFAAGELF